MGASPFTMIYGGSCHRIVFKSEVRVVILILRVGQKNDFCKRKVESGDVLCGRKC
jgi:hypothetical protein